MCFMSGLWKIRIATCLSPIAGKSLFCYSWENQGIPIWKWGFSIKSCFVTPSHWPKAERCHFLQREHCLVRGDQILQKPGYRCHIVQIILNYQRWTIPIGSMYGIHANIYHQYTPNVSIYTIHGSYGFGYFRIERSTSACPEVKVQPFLQNCPIFGRSQMMSRQTPGQEARCFGKPVKTSWLKLTCFKQKSGRRGATYILLIVCALRSKATLVRDLFRDCTTHCGNYHKPLWKSLWTNEYKWHNGTVRWSRPLRCLCFGIPIALKIEYAESLSVYSPFPNLLFLRTHRCCWRCPTIWAPSHKLVYKPHDLYLKNHKPHSYWSDE